MYLVTGGAGFVGQYLIKELIKRRQEIRVLDIKDKPEWMPKEVEYVQGDITDIEDTSKACKDVKIIFNLASLLVTSKASSKRFSEVNAYGIKTLIDGAIMNKVKKIIHTSSDMVYGIMKSVPAKETDELNPVGPYGRSKVISEQICKQYMDKIPITILRPGPIIGQGRGGLFTILFDWITNNKKVYVIGDGSNRFQKIDVRDLVQAYLAAETRGDNEIFNIGSENVPTVRDQLEELIVYAGSNSVVTPLPVKLANFSLGALGLLKFVPLDIEHYSIAHTDHVTDISKAKKILKWRPKYNNIDMLKWAYDWFYVHRDEPDPEAKEGFLKILKVFS